MNLRVQKYKNGTNERIPDNIFFHFTHKSTQKSLAKILLCICYSIDNQHITHYVHLLSGDGHSHKSYEYR